MKDYKDGQEKYNPVKMGNLYAATQCKNQRLRDNGYAVIDRWECAWKRYCQKHQLK